MTNLENLLLRHAEGTLTPEEQHELDQLTHRDAVVGAARKRATQLRNRRIASVSAVASVLLVAGVVVAHLSGSGNMQVEQPLMAQADIPATIQTVVSPSSAVSQPENRPVSVATVSRRPVVDAEPAAPITAVQEAVEEQPRVESAASVRQYVDEVAPDVHTYSDIIVACNTDCTPDSVINDIWKFLKA